MLFEIAPHPLEPRGEQLSWRPQQTNASALSCSIQWSPLFVIVGFVILALASLAWRVRETHRGGYLFCIPVASPN